jgi:hypothetical protein
MTPASCRFQKCQKPAVSNRRRLRPPITVTAAAHAYRCGHCPSVTGKPHLDGDGIWHLPIHHNATCPVLSGAVSPVPAGIRCTAAAAAATGERAFYIGTTDGDGS